MILPKHNMPLWSYDEDIKQISSGSTNREESFQARAEEPLGIDSHRTISKRSSECWLLAEHKKCCVLLCPISEQQLLSFISCVGTRRLLSRHTCPVRSPTKCTQSGNFQFDINPVHFKIRSTRKPKHGNVCKGL